MKKITVLLLLFIVHSMSAQNDSLLRTDGIYIFDNGLDTIVQAPSDVMDFALQLLKDKKIKDWKDGPCGPATIPSDSSTYLSALAFFNDSTGRMAYMGTCRDEQHIRNTALRLLTKQVMNDTSKVARQDLLADIHLQADSSLRFLHFQDGCPFENFWGKAAGDTLYLEMNKSIKLVYAYINANRKYIFYPYSEIFNCTWVYKKPPPIIKDEY